MRSLADILPLVAIALSTVAPIRRGDLTKAMTLLKEARVAFGRRAGRSSRRAGAW